LSLDALTSITAESTPNLKCVVFEGDKGDSAMNPNMYELITHFGFVKSIRMYTNGGVQKASWWEKLATIPNLEIVWSIDGLEDTNHLYRVNVKYSKVMTNLKAFVAAGGRAVWKCILFKHNQHQIQNIKATAKDIGIPVLFRSCDTFRFNNKAVWPVKIDGVYSHDLLPTTLSEMDIKQQADYENLHTYRNIVFLPKSRDLLCPWSKNHKMYINCQGHVVPCCMMHFDTTHDYYGKTQLLNIVGGTFDNISLYHHSLADILNKSVFYSNSLEDSLKNKNTRLSQCDRSCGNQL
jgi:sulfatase maturation enzyme AslB (radical SAM superfamily)